MTRPTPLPRRLAALLCILYALTSFSVPAAAQAFKVLTVAEGFDQPTAIAVLPDGSVLVIERRGGVFHLNFDGTASGRLPVVLDDLVLRQTMDGWTGGLLDVVADPDYTANHLIYLSYSKGNTLDRRIAVLRARLNGTRISDSAVIFEGTPARTDEMYGKMAFGADKTLFLSMSWGSPRDRTLWDDAGRIVRINRDGTIPADNPFARAADARIRREIYASGLNADGGLALNPVTKTIWLASLGKLVREVRPFIYNNGSFLAPDDSPMLLMPDALGLSGPDFYDGASFPDWRGDMIVGGGFTNTSFRVVHFNGLIPVSYRDYTDTALRSICDIKSAPDGSLLALSCAYKSRLLRIVPPS